MEIKNVFQDFIKILVFTNIILGLNDFQMNHVNFSKLEWDLNY
jgi:hypothetical protein